MRKLLIILLLFASVNVFGQVKVRVLVQDACADSLIVPAMDVNNQYFLSPPLSPFDKNGVTFLEDGKECWFSGFYSRSNEYGKPINFRFVAHADLDTLIRIPKIAPFRVKPFLVNPDKYYNCNKLCQGYCADYYEDGSLRMEGHFSKGIPKGELKFYYPNGNLRRSEKHVREKFQSGQEYVLAELRLFYEDGTIRKHLKYDKIELTEVLLYDEKGQVYLHEQYDPYPGSQKRTYKSETEDSPYYE